MGPSLPSNITVAIAVTTVSSLVSLLCTAAALFWPLFLQFSLRWQSQGTNNRGGHWQTRAMMASPTPSELTQTSGDDALLRWPSASTAAGSTMSKPVNVLNTAQLAADHFSQQVFLAVVTVSLLRASSNEAGGLDFFLDKGLTFACALVLSLRVFFPLAATLSATTSHLKQCKRTAVLLVYAFPAIIMATVTATVALIASAFNRQSTACIVLLVLLGLSVALNTFITLRLLVIQRKPRSSVEQARSKTKRADPEQQSMICYVPPTVSTAGTKASSVNPYDVAIRSKLQEPVAAQDPPSTVLLHTHTIPMSSPSCDRGEDVTDQPRTSKNGSEVLPGAGALLRVYPSAGQIMEPLSSLSPGLHPILFGLAGVWLVSVRAGRRLLYCSAVRSEPLTQTAPSSASVCPTAGGFHHCDPSCFSLARVHRLLHPGHGCYG